MEKEKLYDLQNQRKTLIDEAREMALEGKHESEEYRERMERIKSLAGQIEAVRAAMDLDEPAEEPDWAEKSLRRLAYEPREDETVDAVKAFAAAARAGFPVEKAAGDYMSEGVDPDGGYTVPEDIVNRILRLRETRESLLGEVTVIPVKTKSGRRTIKKRSQHAGFVTVAEAAKTPKVTTPQYETLSYEIEKRSGYLPVTVELYEDSDANIAQEAVNWLAEESTATINKEIIAAVKENAETDLGDLDGIKRAWIGLGKAFRRTSKIHTNADGLLWLGTLKDKNGRDLLTPNPADPKQLQLCVGPYVIPVKDWDNDTLPSDGGKIPMIVGDLKEGIVYWDRRSFSIRVLDQAVIGEFNTAENDFILWKGSQRDDCTRRDNEAFINGYISGGAETPAG